MRYARQEALLGKQAQKKLSKKTITIVGLGALGSTTANLLARAGINLRLIDYDAIDITNLQRQTLYEEQDIGASKAETAQRKLQQINKEIHIEAHNKRLTERNINEIKADLIIDCTDNLTTRFMINEYCYNKHPWIHTAAIKYTGVLFNILPGGPCLKCLYTSNKDLGTCEEFGVLNSITTITASLAVSEAIKILLNKQPEKKLIRFNINTNEIEKIQINKRCEKCLKSL